jgi:hypothetical protein
MTPVAGGITDGKKDGFVLAPGLFKSGFAPRVPIYGIVGVLLKVGTFFGDEMVGHEDVSRFWLGAFGKLILF